MWGVAYVGEGMSSGVIIMVMVAEKVRVNAQLNFLADAERTASVSAQLRLHPHRSCIVCSKG